MLHRYYIVTVVIQRYYIVIDYIPDIVHFIPMTHLLCNWKFVPLDLPHLFIFSFIPLSSGTHMLVLFIHQSVSVLLCLFICFVF